MPWPVRRLDSCWMAALPQLDRQHPPPLITLTAAHLASNPLHPPGLRAEGKASVQGRLRWGRDSGFWGGVQWEGQGHPCKSSLVCGNGVRCGVEEP